MARKSIKGYAEKNYYDNTRFNGGIVATNDPLNEGSFKHLVNLDITDTGQSVTPRKGFLTTSMQGTNNITHNLFISTDSIKTQAYKNSDYYNMLYRGQMNAWCPNGPNASPLYGFCKYIIIIDSEGRIAYANSTSSNGYDYKCNSYYSSNVSEHPLFTVDTSTIPIHYNLYLKPGFTAIGFGQLDAFNIPKLLHTIETHNYETIVSYNEAPSRFTLIGPEITTLFCSNKAIYFYDESLGEYIFVNFSNDDMSARRATFDIKDNFIKDTKLITNIDVSDIENIIPDDCYIVPSNSNQAIRALDEYHTAGYIIKVDLKNPDDITVKSLWLRLFYRENASEFEGKSYEADTLVISYLNTSDVVNYVDTTQRNLASSESIIPDPMQEIYEIRQAPIGHYDRLPMIYMKQNGKYLINAVNKIDEIEIIPNFYLEQIDDNRFKWAYTYEFVSTDRTLKINDESIYPSPIYDLFTHKPLLGASYVYNLFYTQRSNTLNFTEGSFVDNVQGVKTLGEYANFFTNNLLTNKTSEKLPSYIIYVVPRMLPNDSYINRTIVIPDKDSDEYKLLLNNKLGGMYSYFCTWTINAPTLNETDETLIQHNSCAREHMFKSNCCKEQDVTNLIQQGNIDNFDSLFNYYVEYLRMGIYIVDTSTLTNYDNADSFQQAYETCLTSKYYAWKELPITEMDRSSTSNDPLYKKLKSSEYIVKFLNTCTHVNIYGNMPEIPLWNKLFPEKSTGMHYVYSTEHALSSYYTYTYASNDIDEVITKFYYNANIEHPMFLSGDESENLTTYPVLKWVNNYGAGIVSSIFDNPDDILTAHITDSNFTNYLRSNHFFDQGVILNFYLVQYEQIQDEEYKQEYSRDFYTASTSLKISRQLIKTQQPITTYVERLEEDPRTIAKANNSIIFESPLGDHLVLWVDNKVYISKENMQYYFTEEYKHEFSEPVVKVIAYKDMLLVFSTQHLYAIYLYEDTINVENGTNEDGTTKYVQQKVYQFAKLPVLYNLLVSEKYKEVIQVYNQMVLFYSADGQLFLIKPTAAIDSNTRFSIQYFNKSANDILLNYKDYMQDRLYSYGLSDIIKDEDVIIKATANINYIKIFYCVPGLITYILIYDVINNRYTVYDTLSFTKINSLQYIPTGELYITEHDGQLYFTVDNNNMNDVDTNTDIAYYNNFSPFPINAEIDTGTINLNNHLKKRFKDLHVIYKNLNANTLEFSLDTYVDDVPIMTHIESNLEIRNVSGYNTLVTLDTNKVTQLVNKLEEMLLKDELLKNNALFNFTDYTSNKIITHKTNIVSKGKTIRVKMNFISKGRYKIQGYGLIYKEHTV